MFVVKILMCCWSLKYFLNHQRLNYVQDDFHINCDIDSLGYCLLLNGNPLSTRIFQFQYSIFLLCWHQNGIQGEVSPSCGLLLLGLAACG